MKYNSGGQLCTLPGLVTAKAVPLATLTPGKWWFGDPCELFGNPDPCDDNGDDTWTAMGASLTFPVGLTAVTLGGLTMYVAGTAEGDGAYETLHGQVVVDSGLLAFAPYALVLLQREGAARAKVENSGVSFTCEEPELVDFEDGTWTVDGALWCPTGHTNRSQDYDEQ